MTREERLELEVARLTAWCKVLTSGLNTLGDIVGASEGITWPTIEDPPEVPRDN